MSTEIPFYKMHGIGNDFILVEGADFPADTDLYELAILLCDRHFGIGADGLILHFPSRQAAERMQIINSDGSEAEMCGNGLRCFARYLYEVCGQRATHQTIETLAGVLETELNAATGQVHVNMGPPILAADKIPATDFPDSPVVGYALEVDGQTFAVTLVSMGNPHCVIFVPQVDAVPLARWGSLIETMDCFPHKTNVEFVQIESPTRARIRVWERGAGATLACGTGACAVLVAGVLNGLLEPEACLELPGGPLRIHWDRERNVVMMSGPTAHVFKGTFQLADFQQ